MSRIFSTLAVFSTALLIAAFVLGWMIDDPSSRDAATQQLFTWHFLTAVAGLMFAALVHAVVLTYFMGTSRWLEEASLAYRLDPKWAAENRALKYQTLPWMAAALVLLIVTGGLGAVADPASPAGAGGFFGIPASTVHFLFAAVTVAANAAINLAEYGAITRNGELIEEVMAEVHRIRREKGLPVEAA